MWRVFNYLLLTSLPFVASGRLCFVSVALPVDLHLYFDVCEHFRQHIVPFEL